MARLWPAYLMRHGPILACLVFSNEKACLAMGSIGHLCSTIQGSTWYLSLMTVQALREVSVFDQAVLLLPCHHHYPRPGLNVVIKPLYFDNHTAKNSPLSQHQNYKLQNLF